MVLMVPNIGLCITEHMPVLATLTNLILPLGAYCLLTSASKNCGRNVLFCIPLMLLAAFQIVLLYLYGESIIGVDMFLNVATTSYGEAVELLGNMGMCIVFVIILYLPFIVLSIVAMAKHLRLDRKQKGLMNKISLWGIGAGLICLLASYLSIEDFSIIDQVYPANVVDNICIALQRTDATKKHAQTSAGFTYDARSVHPGGKEIYVLVIGETSRAENWQLLGYEKETNPRLALEKNVVAFDHAMSESNTTHKSVPMLMSSLDARNFNDIYHTKSVITAFKEAGFATAFISNEPRNRSFVDFFGEEADLTLFLRKNNVSHPDEVILEPMDEFLKDCESDKIFIVLHTYGSHFNYRERYPEDFSFFKPDYARDAKASQRERLVNAYDNTIRYTDYLLFRVIERLRQEKCDAGMVYASDHGEDIFDDYRRRFMHASPNPSYHQLHVPMLVWLSDGYVAQYPEKLGAASANRSKQVSSSLSVFNTLMEIAGLRSQLCDTTCSVTNTSYREPPRLYVNDRNETVSIREAGLKKIDFEELHKYGLK